jgi:hypothetical protein
MDGGAARTTLVDNINTAFSPANIAESVARLERLSPRADFLSISRELGILGDMDEPTFRRYRRNLTIPRLIQQILTVTHRAALSRKPPVPMHIEINDVTPPSIEITVTDQLISIRLNRPHPHSRVR